MVTVMVVGAVLVISLIVFLLYRSRKERHERVNLGRATPVVNPRGLGSIPRISVKDHINNLGTHDLLKSKISINDPKKIRQYPVERIAYEKDLGEGQFGQVFQGRAAGLNESEPEAKDIVAVKTLKKGSSNKAKADFNQEACLMNFLSHPNVVKLLAVSTMEEPYCMIFEFMSNGDLNEYLRNSEPLVESMVEASNNNKNYLPQDVLIKMSIDAAKGLQYLASHHLVHRDVATRNCLVADDLTIKIADFGLSRDIHSENYYKVERETMLPIRWLSPESIIFGKFTLESDVYSYGVLLWEIFAFSKQPYSGYSNEKVMEFIPKGVQLAKPEFCPEFVYTIMKDCWTKEPQLRPHYHLIIDRLNGKELAHDQPGQRWSYHRPCTAFHKNVSLHENELDENLKTVERNEKPPIAIACPEDYSHGKNRQFVTHNAMNASKEKLKSGEGFYQYKNVAMELDSEAEDKLVGTEGNEDSQSTQKSKDNLDTDFNRITKYHER